MKKKKLLDSIDVKSPCNESWDEMFGNDEVRFCSHCAKNVHNLSAMTPQKAEELIKNSSDKLCVRYIKTPQGKLITAPPMLTKLTRRAAIAASVLATSLTLSTMAYSQGEPIVKKDSSNQTQKDRPSKDESKQELAIISGTLKNIKGEVIPNAKVTLHNLKKNEIRITQSNEKGFYEFGSLESSNYRIEVERAAYLKVQTPSLEILKNVKAEQNFILQYSYEFIGDVIIIMDFPELSGTIKDANGGLIPKAKVTLRNTATNEVRITQTNENGIYEFKDVEPNIYELSVESLGFKKKVLQNLEILQEEKVEKNIILEVGEATIGVVDIVKEPPVQIDEVKLPEQKVEQKPLIETPEISQTITMGYLIKDLPIISRNALELLKLTPTEPKKEESPKPKKKKN